MARPKSPVRITGFRPILSESRPQYNAIYRGKKKEDKIGGFKIIWFIYKSFICPTNLYTVEQRQKDLSKKKKKKGGEREDIEGIQFRGLWFFQ